MLHVDRDVEFIEANEGPISEVRHTLLLTIAMMDYALLIGMSDYIVPKPYCDHHIHIYFYSPGEKIWNIYNYRTAAVSRDYGLFKDRVGQYVFISSASAYKKPVNTLPITERTPLENPFWEYSRKKIGLHLHLH